MKNLIKNLLVLSVMLAGASAVQADVILEFGDGSGSVTIDPANAEGLYGAVAIPLYITSDVSQVLDGYSFNYNFSNTSGIGINQDATKQTDITPAFVLTSIAESDGTVWGTDPGVILGGSNTIHTGSFGVNGDSQTLSAGVKELLGNIYIELNSQTSGVFQIDFTDFTVADDVPTAIPYTWESGSSVKNITVGAPVPEPTNLALLGLGSLGLLVRRHRAAK